MNNLQQTSKNKDSFTSLELQDQINFFRQKESGEKAKKLSHADLLKIIRKEFGEEIGQGNISLSSYFNSQNKQQPMFVLSLSYSKQVLLRESTFVRRQVIKYIEALENEVIALKTQLSSADRYALSLQTLGVPEAVIPSITQVYLEKDKLQIENNEQRGKLEEFTPKAEFYDKVSETKNTFCFIDACALAGLSIGRNKLFELLRADGVLMATKHNMPYKKYMQQGIFIVVEQAPYVNQETGEAKITTQTRFTQKGIEWLTKKYAHLIVDKNQLNGKK